MNLTKDLRSVTSLLGQGLSLLLWVVATAWIGARVLWRLGRLVFRMRDLFSQTARCPRGHRVPLYGAHRCGGCGVSSEGYIFRTCRFCGSTPAWTPCPRCRLGIGNPLR